MTGSQIQAQSRSAYGLGGSDGPSWRQQARCADADPDLAFCRVEGVEADTFIAGFCRPCPVRQECYEHALRTGAEYGIFGGLTPTQRRNLQALGWQRCGNCGVRFAPRTTVQQWCRKSCGDVARLRKYRARAESS